MNLVCEKCGKSISISDGEYIYYQNIIMFACKNCATSMKDEVKCGLKICTYVNGKKGQAEFIANNPEAFNKLVNNTESTLKKIPDTGAIKSDIPLLLDILKSYFSKEYTNISYNAIVTIIATLLYVNSPIDVIPDVIPVIGYTDDAMAVELCKKAILCDLENYIKVRHIS